MWCEKCHYGSEHVRWKLDPEGKFFCTQCRSLETAVNKSPFSKEKSMHGKREKAPPKKFKFDQEGGRDSDSPIADKPIENPAVDKTAKGVSKKVEKLDKPSEQPETTPEQLEKKLDEVLADKPIEQPKIALKQPVEPQKAPLEPKDESKLTPFVAQPKPVEPEGQNEANLPTAEKK